MVKQPCRHNTTDEECQLVVRGSHTLLISFFPFPNWILTLSFLPVFCLLCFFFPPTCLLKSATDQSSPKRLISNTEWPGRMHWSYMYSILYLNCCQKASHEEKSSSQIVLKHFTWTHLKKAKKNNSDYCAKGNLLQCLIVKTNTYFIKFQNINFCSFRLP